MSLELGLLAVVVPEVVEPVVVPGVNPTRDVTPVAGFERLKVVGCPFDGPSEFGPNWLGGVAGAGV